MHKPYSYRDDPAVPDFPDDNPIIIFDGVCVMCSAWARFILKHDRSERYRLLPAQTDLGAALYHHYGLNPIDYETNVLIENGRAYFKSTGTIRMFVSLGLPWSLMAVFRIIPEGIRDKAYEMIARNRYRWFGKRDTCYIATQAEKKRFLP
ncbi:MAG: thiol-disulfide oxidoreductase DCC family protein [Alphaproteobacteria bacterium]|nr:thiol-disulfide oxidoreductase DCC family protein [Alphaproteobacteria bacterium]